MTASWIWRVTLLAVISAALLGYRAGGAAPHLTGGTTMAFTMTSKAFESGGNIPQRFTCDGLDVSPALAWSDPPAGTRSLALIVDDPDAPMGTWVHWVAYSIPANARGLPENVAKAGNIAGGGLQGVNDFRKTGYGGPCPPPGRPHRYYFKLYALDRELNLRAGASKPEVEAGMKGHVLAQAELIGRYGR